MMSSDTHKIIIRADRMPAGEHIRRCPKCRKSGNYYIVGDQFQPRDIVLHRRNEQLTKVAETHRCYDALQYLINFWYGTDGYNFKVKMVNTVSGEETNKKCSAMNYYSHRLMVLENENNPILQCRQLFHQYKVDRYAKIKAERLIFFRLNQTRLRSEECVHLRDAVVHDGNTTNVRKLTILLSSYTVHDICMFMLKIQLNMFVSMGFQTYSSMQSGLKRYPTAFISWASANR
ncbi:helitron_like_N domain-containing protein [Trichonephila clavipes]|nr:helitron_like_N domain-containing protein [Trichonephila clavipes]